MNAPSKSFSRRSFIQASALLTGSLAVGAAFKSPAGWAAEASNGGTPELPEGAAPAPVSFPHFPDRLHAFVWRNWPLVPAERMAEVVGARKADILHMGRAMGLDGPPRITEDQRRRSYITVIKRNWHLLPYSQLLELLGWTAGQLAYTLREDDFLFIKLGSLKPRCERLRYQAPDSATLTREREIARIVREAFPAGVTRPAEPLFEFVSQLSRLPTERRTAPTSENLRFCYSYFALYGDPLLEKDADPYPDGLLARLAEAGVNGVWLQAVLYKLSPFPWQPELSENYQERLRNLQTLAARAQNYGIRIFLYLNEPRAMPLGFFERQPQLKGVTEGDHATLCTSVPEVRDYIVNAVEGICRAVPKLGGFFSISASENLTNCWSHGGGARCPRCAARGPAEVIAGVNGLFYEGIRKSGQDIRLLVWDWGWDDAWAPEVIQQLPPAAALMSVSEWRLPIERGGVKSEVGEYSLSSVGPGPRAQKHWKVAQARGLRTVAKIQAANSWELSAIPWIPAVFNTAQHAENLSRAGVKDLMLGWTLGGYPSPNLEVVSEALACGSAVEAMKRVAERRFGAALAPAAVQAWEQFSLAFREFPYHIGVVYSGPQQLGPANLLWNTPTGYHATMVGFAYDDLDAWRAVYPKEVFISQLDKVADGLMRALKELDAFAERPMKAASKSQRQSLDDERRMAEAAAIHFRSTANQARFVMARQTAKATVNVADAPTPRDTMQRTLEDEMVLARRLHELQSRDSRIGFEASNHYFYVPVDLAEKVLNCRHLLNQL